MTFNKKEYDMDYRKKKKKQFTVDLNIEEYEELTSMLERLDMTKVGFVRNAITNLKFANSEE